MTDRIHSLTVLLESDWREDDVESIINSILMTKGVFKVEKHVTDPVAFMARERARQELRKQMIDILYPGPAAEIMKGL